MNDGIPLDLEALQHLQRRPSLFEPDGAPFWDDPHIARALLPDQIDAQTDAASRRGTIIDREVTWLLDTLGLNVGDAVLDLGCGPGLYAERLARRGLVVTGIDLSEHALTYARNRAQASGLDITYLLQDYLALDFEAQLDAVLMVNGDFCALGPRECTLLLGNVHRALKPGACFALDVLTPAHGDHHTIDNHWYVAAGGFWSAKPHLVLAQGFRYPEARVSLNQYVIVEADGAVTVHRNWFQHYTVETIRELLEQQGFSVAWVGADLRGDAHTEDAEWIGVLAQKPPAIPSTSLTRSRLGQPVPAA